MPTKRIPLFGSMTSRNADPNSSTGKDQRFINCFPEVIKNPISDGGYVNLNKRVGCSSTAVTAGFTPTPGAVVWTGNSAATAPIVFMFTKTGSKIGFFNGASQVGADIDGIVGYGITETAISGVGNLVATVLFGSVQHTWYFPEGGAWTEITDADFPPKQGTPIPTTGLPAHMDGFMFVMCQNGQIWNSDLNSVANWTASSFITAQSMPDGGVGLARYKNLVVAFGKYSIEFFQNAGTTPSPLLPIGNALRRIGALPAGISNTTILPVSDTIYFIGQESESGKNGVYRLNGYQPEKVSNAAVDRWINESNMTIGFAGAIIYGGMTHILLITTTTVRTWAYCIDNNTWWEFEFQAGGTYMIAAVGSQATTKFVMSTGAKIYTANAAAGVGYQDDATTFTQLLQTDNLDFESPNLKFQHRLRPLCDVQAATSTLTIEKNDNDFDASSWVTLGTIDLSSRVAIEQGLSGGGSFRRRSYRLTHAANTANRMTAMDVDYTLGRT